MKKSVFFSLLLSPILAFSQTQAEINSAEVNSKGVAESSTTLMVSDPVRKAKMNIVKMLADTALFGRELLVEKIDFNDANNYSRFLATAKGVLKRRLQEKEDSKLVKEAQTIRRALSEMISADCLEQKKADRAYARQKDLEGNEIFAFDLTTIRKNARYGFVDNYRESFVRIKKDQVYGFLNVCGDEVIPCQYEMAEAFNNGKALVKKVVWYYVTYDNQESDALFNVADAKPLLQGISIAKFNSGKFALIDNRYDLTKKPTSAFYDEIVPFSGKEIYRVRLGNSFGLINLQGQVVLSPSYELIEPSGAAHLMRLVEKGKVGLMDTTWKIKVEPTYRQITDFDAYGVAWAQSDNGYCLLSSSTYANSATYKTITSFNKRGLAVTQSNSNTFGIINNQLDVILEPKYAFIGEFNEFGLSIVSYPNKKFGYINTLGNEIIPPAFDEIGTFNSNGLVIAKDEHRNARNKVYKTSEVYNKYGQAIITRTNDTVGMGFGVAIDYEFLDTLVGKKFAAVKKFIDGDAVGIHLIELKSSRLMTPFACQSLMEIDENGLMRYRYNGRWGLLDTSGRVALQPTYSEIRRPGEGYYAVKDEEDKYGFIDKRGKIQIALEFADVKTFKKGHCVVTKGKEKWGLINKFNAKVVPCYFKYVNLSDDKIEMKDDKGNKYVIDEKGDCLENCPKFEEIRRKANN
jgi:WG containing repeat